METPIPADPTQVDLFERYLASDPIIRAVLDALAGSDPAGAERYMRAFRLGFLHGRVDGVRCAHGLGYYAGPQASPEFSHEMLRRAEAPLGCEPDQRGTSNVFPCLLLACIASLFLISGCSDPQQICFEPEQCLIEKADDGSTFIECRKVELP